MKSDGWYSQRDLREYLISPMKCRGMSGLCYQNATKHVTDRGKYVTSFCAECFHLEFSNLVTNRYQR